MTVDTSAPLKICFFTKTYLPKVGGAEWMAHNLAVALQKRGHRIVVLAPYQVRRGEGPLPTELEVRHYLKPFSKKWGTRIALPQLLWAHLRHRFDLLHCHAAYPQGYIAWSFHRLTGVPYLIAPYGTEIVRGERERNVAKVEARIRSTVPKAAASIAISRYIADELISADAPPERVHVIPCGVDVASYAQAEPYRRARPYLFMMGRMHRVKGIDYLLQAWKIIESQLPGIDLLIAGGGPELERYRSLAGELGIGARVEFLGSVTEQQKASLYRGALLFTCPSHMEHFGIVNIEALAAGVPVVSSNVGGIPDIVRPGENGLLVPHADSEALADALLSVLGNHGFREHLARGAEASRNRYDWSNVAKEYENLYRNVLNH